MAWYNPLSWGDESKSSKAQRSDLNETGLASNQFAEYLQGGVQQLGGESQALRQMLADQAAGRGPSLASEQLRQGLQSNVAAQRSMAASAAPQNAAMAARQAALNAGRLGMGMSGQAAAARIQEQEAARRQLAEMLLQQRQQDMQGALGSRQNAISGYGAVTPEKSGLDKNAPLINAAVGIAGAAMGRK